MKYSVVFDLDGTLLDLPVEIEQARADIAEMFAKRGYHQPIRPILPAINQAAATIADNDEEIYPLIIAARAILDKAETLAAAKAVLRPGALETLDILKRQGVALGIVTNNSRACIPAALAILKSHASDFVVSTRDDVRRPKPAPDGLIRVASKLAEAGEIMWFIGDSPVDISAAVAANPQVAPKLSAVAIAGPRSTVQQLRAAGPCVVYQSLLEAVKNITDAS